MAQEVRDQQRLVERVLKDKQNVLDMEQQEQRKMAYDNRRLKEKNEKLKLQVT